MKILAPGPQLGHYREEGSLAIILRTGYSAALDHVMASEASKIFSLYRLKDHSGAIAKLIAMRYTQLPVQGNLEQVQLFTFVTVASKPDWVDLLEEIVQQAESLQNLKRQTPNFVLFLRGKHHTYMTTAGTVARSLLSFVEPDFGLEVIQKLVPHDNIKVERAKHAIGSLEEIQTIHRQRYHRTSESVQTARITSEVLGHAPKQIIKDLIGLDLNRREVVLHATNGFALKKRITIPQLLAVVKAIDEVLPNSTALFPIRNGMSRVKSASLKQDLKRKLVQTLNIQFQAFVLDRHNFEETDIGISLSNPTLLLQLHEYIVYRGGSSVKTEPPLDLFSLFICLQRLGVTRIRMTHLRGITISGFDEDNHFLFEELPLTDLLGAIVTLDHRQFALINRHWYLVDETYVQSVKAEVDELINNHLIEFATSGFPIWKRGTDGKLESEDEYLKGVKVSTLSVLHRKYVRSGAENLGELCDVFGNTGTKHLYFVKRGLGVQMRELCAQAKAAITLLKRDRAFRNEALQLLNKHYAGGLDDNGLRNLIPVLAICDFKRQSHRPLAERISFLAKMELADLKREIDEIHVPLQILELQSAT